MTRSASRYKVRALLRYLRRHGRIAAVLAARPPHRRVRNPSNHTRGAR